MHPKSHLPGSLSHAQSHSHASHSYNPYISQSQNGPGFTHSHSYSLPFKTETEALDPTHNLYKPKHGLRKWSFLYVLISINSAVIGTILIAIGVEMKSGMALAIAGNEAVLLNGICSSQLKYEGGIGCATMYEIAAVQSDEAVTAALGSFANIYALHCSAGAFNCLLALITLKWSYVSSAKVNRNQSRRALGKTARIAWIYANSGLFLSCALVDYTIGQAAINKFNKLANLSTVSQTRAEIGRGSIAMIVACLLIAANSVLVYLSTRIRHASQSKSINRRGNKDFRRIDAAFQRDMAKIDKHYGTGQY